MLHSHYSSLLSLFKRSSIKCLLLFILGAISVFAFAPFYQFYIIIISFIGLLLIIDDSYIQELGKFKLNSRKVLLYGYSFGGAYFASQIYWIFYSLYEVIKVGFLLSLSAQVLFVAYLAFYIVLALYLLVKFSTLSRVFNYVVLFPSVWVICEWLRGWLFTGFPWCEVGYVASSVAIFRGVYPLLGNYGVSWLLISISGALALLLISYFKLESKVKYSLIFYILAVVLISTTLSRFNYYTKQSSSPIRVALVQGNVAQGVKWEDSAYALKIYQEDIAKANSDIIVIPETAIPLFENDLPQDYLNDLTSIARNKDAGLIVGMPKIIDKNMDYVNAAVVLTNPNQPFYAKYHLVPYGEYIPFKSLLNKIYAAVNLPLVGFTKGNQFQDPVIVNGQKVAINICYENGFATELIYGAKSSNFMINLSDMVWYGNSIAKDEHLQISQVRALENQRYFLQTTNTGLTAIINPYGQVEALLPPFKRDILTTYITPRAGVTPFEKYANYPIILFCFLIIALSRTKKVLK